MASSPLLLLLLLLLPCHVIISNADDILPRGQYIKDGQTLISAASVFELGFFSPGNSTSRYVGIWYHNISTQSLVWVANRESPLNDTSGSITVAGDGSLIVLDGQGSSIWSSNSSTQASTNTTAQLNDSGNLVLQGSNGVISWQSFDHLTDTFIPGMQVTLDRKTGKNQVLSAWKSPNDPSPGNYTLGLDPQGSAQILIWEGKKVHWRSGQWNGQTFIGTMMRPLNIYGFKLISDAEQGIMYFTFSSFNSSLLRFVLQSDGVENTTMLVGEENKTWESVWVQPLSQCEIYGKCGDYAVCIDDGTPRCECLKGFDPTSINEWNQGNWTGGCARRSALQCQLNGSGSSSNGDGNGFWRMEGLKLPDHSDWATTIASENDCRSACMNNCTCKAYAYPFGIGCLIWGRDLVDIYQFTQSGSDLYIKLASPEFGTNTKTRKFIVVFTTLGFFILVTAIFSWWKCNARIRDCWKSKKNGSLDGLHFSQEVIPDFSGPRDIEAEGEEEKGLELPLFNFDSLATATANFSDENKLGKGGFGIVYKGMLPEGREIAIKRLSASSGQGLDEFKNEVIFLSNLQHRNLVRLLGCCIQGEEKMLIYEYMRNKSLDTFIFDPAKQGLLDWKNRFNIIEGVARGLLYLHRDSRVRIVHRDLKSSNILLDEHMNPKISDFGMAKIFGGDQFQGTTIRVVGTIGYMSPEYAMEGLFSVKSDVYSFGVLVLEIVTGRKNSSFHRIESSLNIVGYVWEFWNEDRTIEIIDPSLKSSYSSHQVLRCVQIALLCVQDRPDDRPDVSSVLHMLGSEGAIFTMPKQPKFTIVENNNNMKGDNMHECFSASSATITIVEAR